MSDQSSNWFVWIAGGILIVAMLAVVGGGFMWVRTSGVHTISGAAPVHAAAPNTASVPATAHAAHGDANAPNAVP